MGKQSHSKITFTGRANTKADLQDHVDSVHLLPLAMRSAQRKMEKAGKNCFSHRRHHGMLLMLLLISLVGIFVGGVEGNGEREIESCVVQPRLSTNSHSASAAGGLGFSSGQAVQNDGTGASSISAGGPNDSLLGGEGGGGGSNNNNNDPPYSLICHIRTLSPNLDLRNLTSRYVTSLDVTSLHVVCNDVLFFQSELISGQLSYMPELHDLTIENCKLTKLPYLGLPNLRSLTVNTGNSEWAAKSLEIEPDALPTHIRSLNIAYNNLWSLTNLCKLALLQTLVIKKNLLSDIEDLGLPGRPALGNINSDASNDEMECLPDLQILDMSYNMIRSLGSGRLKNLKNLRDLRLEYNWLEELEDDSLYGLGQLRKLNASSNRLVALPTKLLFSTVLLRHLDFSNNSISSLSSSLFLNLSHLEILDLSYNALSSQLISTDIFKGLIRLVVLKLSHNMLSHLGQGIFDDLYTLQVLDLSANMIKSIDENTFASLKNLHSLNLSRNRITMIALNTFSPLRHPVIAKMNLDYNLIESIEEGAINSTSLQDLSIVGNQLRKIPNVRLPMLKTLDVAENHISSLENDSFIGMNQLIGLRLVKNNLTQLPAGLCDPIRRLRVLNVAENNISSSKISPHSFTSCRELRVLRLDSNNLEFIPPTLAPQLPSLLWLNMSGNNLQRVDFSQLPKTIEWLDVSHNNLEYLGGAWSGNHGNNSLLSSNNGAPHKGHHHHSHLGISVRVIEASFNRLGPVLDHHSIPPMLEKISLNHNQLKTVAPETFSRAHRLMKVELVGNEIETLTLASIRFPPVADGVNLPSMYIGGNPLTCDCKMEWLTRVDQLEALKQYPRIVDLDSIICRLPFSRTVTHMPLIEATPKDFLCKYESFCFSLCHCCLYEACDCFMRCPPGCSCYHDSSWSTSVVNCASTGQNAVPSLPMDAHEVYLDGNPFDPPTLKSHTFIGRKNLKTLYLNGSHIEKISNKSFNGLLTLQVLRLNNNLLRHLNGYEFESLSNLKELYLEKNLIETIANTTFLGLRNLLILKLEGNRLHQFAVWQLSLNPYLVEIGLANPYTCDCQFLHHLYGWVSDNSRKIIDLAQLQCVWNTTNKPGPHLIDYNRTCGSSWALMENGFDFYTMSPLPIALVFVSLVTLLILVVALVILCRENFSLWLYTKFAFRFCETEEFEDDKSYDSYLIYSQKDEEFVAARIADELETNDNYRLCLHYRDLICETGDFKDMMIGAVENSKSVLIILSRNFLQGEWSSGEYRSAFHAVLKKSQRSGHTSKTPAKKILIVFIEDIPKVEISPDIRSWVRHNSIKVIKWNIHSTDHGKNRKFWNKLKFVLPDPSSHYHSNITSNTTTTSASSNEAHGGIMATLKYSATVQGDSNNIHHSISHPHHNNIHPHYPHQQIIVDESGRFTTTTTGAPPQIISSSQTNTLNSIKYWPYGATNFVALPPKYQQNTSHHSSSGGSHPPSVNSPGSAQSTHYHPPLPLSNPPKSPPSSQSTDSTTTMADDVPSLMSQLTMASYHSAANGHSGVNNMSLTKSPVPVPKSSYSRNIIPTSSVNSPIMLSNASNSSNNGSSSSNSSTKSNNGGGESYGIGGESFVGGENGESIEGEHVYSTLDPPSPQPVQQTMSLMSQNILGNGSSANGVGANFLNNIHLPNGYTYHVQQQWLGNNHPHHLTSNHQQSPIQSSNGGGKHNHHHHQHQQGAPKGLKKKDTSNPVQTYLV